MNCKRETECCRLYTHCYTCQYNEIDEEVTINQLIEIIKQPSESIYEETLIFVGNPLYLAKLDMYEFPSNCYFVSVQHIPKDEIYKVNGDWKRFWHEFIKEHPDKVFRGKKI